MKVAEARVYLVQIGGRHPVLVQFFTDEGISGVGEAAIAYGTGATAAAGMIKDLVEAHLLDFSGDLYGRLMRLEFLAWIRAQQRFDSPADLQKQVVADIARIREVCSSAHPAV